MNRKNRALAIVAGLLVVLAGLPCWSVYREIRQARLDHALIAAIKAQDDKKTLELLADGANGEARDGEKSLTLREALLHLLNHFHRSGSPPSIPPENGEHLSAILLYCRETCSSHGADLTVVRSLLDHGARVNDQGGAFGWTPLIYAIGYFNGDMVRLLLQHGANIEARGIEDQYTPLMWAAKRENPDAVRVLLEHGAKVSAIGPSGVTALDFVSDQPSVNARQIAALLRHQAQIR